MPSGNQSLQYCWCLEVILREGSYYPWRLGKRVFFLGTRTDLPAAAALCLRRFGSGAFWLGLSLFCVRVLKFLWMCFLGIAVHLHFIERFDRPRLHNFAIALDIRCLRLQGIRAFEAHIESAVSAIA